MVETKHCKKCDSLKSLDDFHKDSRSKDGRTSYCKECQKAKSRQWYSDNPERAAAQTRLRVERNPDVYRDGNYRRKYGITIEQYNEMLEEQNGVCAVCAQPESRVATANLAVDHCHSTNIVRGLLCSNCNRALGLLGDDANRIEALAKYVRSYCESTKSSGSK